MKRSLVAALLLSSTSALAQEEPNFVGTAAPATSAATTPLTLQVKPGLEVFAQYAYRRTLDESGRSQWFHQFDVPRVHLALDAEAEDAHGRVLIEAVRSASEGALIGVAGDSWVMRLREAYAGYSKYGFEGRAGVVPLLTIPELEGTWMLRAVAPDPRESSGLLTPADVGANVRYTLPKDYAWVGVGAQNGEGYTNRELNRGKNAEAAASIHPLPAGPLKPLAVFVGYQLGSSGTGLARADRATGALLWQGDMIRAGASATYAWGTKDDGSQRSWIADGFIRAEPIEHLLFGVRGSFWVRDTRKDPAGKDTVAMVTGAAGYEIATPLTAFAAFTRSLPTDRARTAVPESDYWEARLISRIVF
ncbi:MAG: hypothetical protein KC776_42435 [Myxococcales bacterium]|nr:hypothetical protein [Myxococcales bacterium]MCB9581887.1 hypothetical protein [Polyangiaceae bacterium]